MALFPTAFKPSTRVPLIGGAPYIDVGAGGKLKTSANESLKLEWIETYDLDLQFSSSVNWLAQVEYIFQNGFQVTNKSYYGTLLGAISGTLKISGSGQTGTQIIVYAETGSKSLNQALFAGDLVQIGTGSLVYQIGQDMNTDASGGATMSVMPQVLSGWQPLQTASLTLTPNVSFSGYITSLQIGAYEPHSKQATVTLRFTQSP